MHGHGRESFWILSPSLPQCGHQPTQPVLRVRLLSLSLIHCPPLPLPTPFSAHLNSVWEKVNYRSGQCFATWKRTLLHSCKDYRVGGEGAVLLWPSWLGLSAASTLQLLSPAYYNCPTRHLLRCHHKPDSSQASAMCCSVRSRWQALWQLFPECHCGVWL